MTDITANCYFVRRKGLVLGQACTCVIGQILRDCIIEAMRPASFVFFEAGGFAIDC